MQIDPLVAAEESLIGLFDTFGIEFLIRLGQQKYANDMFVNYFSKNTSKANLIMNSFL